MINVLLYDICVKINSPISSNILSILLHNWDRDASWGSNVQKPYTPVGILHVWWCKRVMVDYEIISLYDIQSNYSHLVLIGWLCDILIKLSPNKQCHVCHEWMESYTTLLLYSQNWSIITVSDCVRIHELWQAWSLFDDMHCLQVIFDVVSVPFLRFYVQICRVYQPCNFLPGIWAYNSLNYHYPWKI